MIVLDKIIVLLGLIIIFISFLPICSLLVLYLWYKVLKPFYNWQIDKLYDLDECYNHKHDEK